MTALNSKKQKKHTQPAKKDKSNAGNESSKASKIPQTPPPNEQAGPQVVDGKILLTELQTYVKRFVSLTEPQARVIAAWAVHTYLFQVAEATPYLSITSAEKQSGKTRLLEVLDTIVHGPWLTASVTKAVLCRKVDNQHPTLLLDEIDTQFGGDKDDSQTLRNVLNSGYKVDGKSSCCVGDEHSVKDFSTFCPKAIAGIGVLPGTVSDRAIPIRLKRALRGEVPERFRRRTVVADSTELRNKTQKWATSIKTQITDARPDLPEELGDRQQDCTEQLVAIADAAGGNWPNDIRSALIALCREAQESDESRGKTLLSDIRQIFKERGVQRLSSADLTSNLNAIETSSWGESNNGKPLTRSRLARLLKPYGISPAGKRIGDKTPRGYDLDQFQDAFKRYLYFAPTVQNGPESATTQQNTGGNKVSIPIDSRILIPPCYLSLEEWEAAEKSKSSDCTAAEVAVPQGSPPIDEGTPCCSVAVPDPAGS